MNNKRLTPMELRRAAYRAIVNNLGAAGLIRFLQDTQKGSGDYTKDRYNWLPEKSLEELSADIIAWREQQ